MRIMEKTEHTLLLELWELSVCPFCGTYIPEGARVGTGRREEGGFCSLDCYARYYSLELLARYAVANSQTRPPN